MSTENTSTADTASETQTVEAPQTETVNNTTETDETSETTSTTPSIEELQERIKRMDASLKKANKEAKDHRLQADELRKFKEQVEAEKLSETEKQELARQNLEKQLADLQKERDDTIRQSQERIVNYEVRLQAARMGIVDPDVAAKLLDWSEIEYDDNGSPSNVDDLLKSLLKSKPYLGASKTVSTSGGATNPSRSATASASQPLSWERLSKMTAQEYDARRPEIQRWMSDPQNIRR